jgi:hypothetical protein
MSSRINRAIELLAQDQPIYYVGGHTGHTLTYEQLAAQVPQGAVLEVRRTFVSSRLSAVYLAAA